MSYISPHVAAITSEQAGALVLSGNMVPNLEKLYPTFRSLNLDRNQRRAGWSLELSTIVFISCSPAEGRWKLTSVVLPS